MLEIRKNAQIEDIFSSRGRTKIIKILAKVGETNISNLIKLTGLNYKNVKIHLNYLLDIGLIQEKKFGRIRIYKYNMELIKAKAIKNLFALWLYLIQN